MPRKIATVALVLALAVVFASTGYAGNRKEARTLYKKGLWDFRSGNIEAAVEHFALSAEKDPDFPHPWLALGRIYQESFETTMHGYAEAVDAYTSLSEILIRNPPDERAKDLLQGYYFMGQLHLKGGDYTKALWALEKFIEVYPDFGKLGNVYNSIGIAYYYLDQYNRAVVNFKRALEHDATLTEARFNLRSVFTRVTAFNEALVLQRAGEPEKALRRLIKLRDLAPRYLAGRRLEAKLMGDLGKPEEAVLIYNEILGFQPNNPETYWMRIDMAKTLISLGENDQAKNVLLENLARFPEQQDQRARMEVVMLLTKLSQVSK